jgi:hypothetical protein
MTRSVPNPVRSALYYPFPVMQDEGWLKEQALFWDGLHRIVPEKFERMMIRGRTVAPSRTQRLLSDEAGFVSDFTVEDRHLKAVAEQFMHLADESPWFAQQSREDGREYFTWGAAEGAKGVDSQPGAAWIIHLHPREVFRYFPGKIYMALLAKRLSTEHGLPVVTDDEEHDRVLKAEDLVPQPASGDDPREHMALLYTITMQRIGCPSIADLPVKRIIDFRRRHDDERRAFVERVEEIVTGLKGRTMASQEELDHLLRDSAAKLDTARRDLVAALRSSRIEATLRSAAVSVPVLTAAMAGGMPAVASGIGGALGVAAVLYGTRRTRRSDLVKDRSAAYLFAIGDEFDPSRQIEALKYLY